MENQMNNDAQFTDKRLDSLREPDGFAPSSVQARMSLEGRAVERSGRWVWKAAVAAAVFLLFIALPTARAIAQTGTLSMDAYGQSLHDTMYDVHRTVAHLIFEIHHLFGD
jgi:hypothetical protein